MSKQRIKGQEVQILLIKDSEAIETLTAIKSFEMSWKLEIKQEGFLGETTDRYDSVYLGVEGKLDFQMEDPTLFAMVVALVDKARRRTPGVKINIKATLNFPSGERVRVLIPEAEFGPVPMNFGSRTDYGSSSLSFGASDAKALTV